MMMINPTGHLIYMYSCLKLKSMIILLRNVVVCFMRTVFQVDLVLEKQLSLIDNLYMLCVHLRIQRHVHVECSMCI